jgi:murein DD-endopeptidase MepM/ murein hydrolase activator NlpD
LERLEGAMADDESSLNAAWSRFRSQGEAMEGARELSGWLQSHVDAFPLMSGLADSPRVIELDFSSRATRMGAHDLAEAGAGEAIELLLSEFGASAAFGRYAEDRDCYKGEQFLEGAQARSVHLGVDIFVPAGTPVHAPFDATVAVVALNDEHLDYGPTVILAHSLAGAPRVFYTLFGHLSMDTLDKLSPGQSIAGGDVFARIGDEQENGHWPPHLHVQVILDLLGETSNFIGVCAPSELAFWKQICPDPARLLGLPEPAARGVVLPS